MPVSGIERTRGPTSLAEAIDHVRTLRSDAPGAITAWKELAEFLENKATVLLSISEGLDELSGPPCPMPDLSDTATDLSAIADELVGLGAEMRGKK